MNWLHCLVSYCPETRAHTFASRLTVVVAQDSTQALAAFDRAMPRFLHPGIEGQSPWIMVHIPFGAVVFPLPTVSVILRMAVCPSWNK